jgi:Cu/Zn superoxide dismutase
MRKIFLSALFFLTAVMAQAQFQYFKAELSGANEVPPNGSTATGLVIARYNTATKFLELYGHYRDLSATIIGSHIHQAPENTPGPVIVTINNSGGTTGILSVKATLTAAQETALTQEGLYVNVHSDTYPEGEIRSQLKYTGGQTDFMESRLQGSQEVPPNPSMAMGKAVALLDRTNNMLYLTGSYSNLSNTISGSHIHTGLPGAIGPVIIPLTNTGSTSGVLEYKAGITDAQETAISTGGTYVNVHSTGTYAAGEIRGQLTNYGTLTFFAGSLSGANESTPNMSTAQGTVIARYDPNTNQLELTGDYQGLSAPITTADLNGPAAWGVEGAVITSISNTGGTSGTLSLSATLSDAREADLYSGLLYVNVRNESYPGGEIRVQLYYTTMSNSYYLTGILQGSQEVPPSGSAGTGTVTTLLDATTGMVYVTGSFSGLGSDATMAHIHQAPPGTAGGVILPLSVTLSTSGTVTGSGTLTQDQVMAMINGGTYVNIHSMLIPTGELRAQLGNLILPVKLLYFNAVKEGGKVNLSWAAAQETNLRSYEVEQQHPENARWMAKGQLAATGGGSSAPYRFTDVPVTGKAASALYRLKMTDIDGKVSYSHIVRVNMETGKGSLVVLSNPVTNGMLRFVVTGMQANGAAEATVVDYSGRVVLKARATLQGTNELPVGNLGAGMYRLVVKVNNELLQQSFVK